MPDRHGAALALELDRDVRDAEVALRASVDLAQHVGGFAETPVVEQHVRRERARSAADRPDVKVVHAGHAADLFDVPLEIPRVDVARDALEQDVGRIAQARG